MKVLKNLKIIKFFLILISILVFVEYVIFSSNENEHVWEKIADFKSSIDIIKYEWDSGIYIQLDNEILQDIIDEAKTNKENNFGPLTLDEYVFLSKYFQKNPIFKAPMILTVIRTPIIKKYFFVFIYDLNNSLINKGNFFAVDKSGENIQIFAKGTSYISEPDEILGIKLSDITIFNKIIKNEILIINNTKISLDILKLFLKINIYSMEIFFNDLEIEKIIKEKCKKYGLNYVNRTLKQFKSIISKPMYQKKNNGYHFIFFTYLKGEDFISFDKWTFFIKNNGEVTPKKIEKYKLDLTVGCGCLKINSYRSP